MTALSIYMLGQLQIRIDDRDITKELRTDKERALLVFLIVETVRAHSREKLAEMFWPEREEGVARTNLRQALSGLRRALGDQESQAPVLMINNETVRVNPERIVWVDLKSFNAHIEASQRHAHKKLETCGICAQRLHEAIDLYHGDLLEGFAVNDSEEFQEWLFFHRERAFTSLLAALEDVVSYYQETGDYETAQEYARQYVNKAPMEERAHQQLMQLLALSGRRTAAIEQYQRCRKMLLDTFNVEPSQETTVLYQQIVAKGGISSLSPPVSSEFSRPPAYLTNFVGRRNELEMLTKYLQNPACKLISVSGMPGSGKTRLVLELSKRVESDFKDGVYFLNLEQINHPAQMVAAIAMVLGVQLADPNNPIPSFSQQCKLKQCLLILDNYTHLTGHAGVLLEILAAAPQLTIILTTQRRLNVQSAWNCELYGLPFPMYYTGRDAANYPSLQLFVARAAQVRPRFMLNQKNTAAVVRICQLTSGLPLAIELAASGLREYSTRQIAEKLDEGLSILSTRMHDIPEKHRNMESALTSSWETLSEREKLILARLAAFRGSFTLDAAQDICEADMGILSSLVDSSFLISEPEQRYSLHKLVQLFARDRLAADAWENQQIRQRHSKYYLDLLHDNVGQLNQVQHRAKALAELEQNLENIRRAVKFSGDQKQTDVFLASMNSLEVYYNTRPHKSNTKCDFWKIELALQENPGDMYRIPLLQMPNLFYPWCCQRTGCLEESNQAVILCNDKYEIIQANYQACQVTGRTLSQLLTLDVRGLWNPEEDVDYQLPEVTFGAEVMRPDGRGIALIVSQTRLAQSDEVMHLFLLQVVDETVDLSSQQDESMQNDPLTGLPNRFAFLDRLRIGIATANRHSQLLGIYLVDLNDLQAVNREHGYRQGDLVLRTVGERLRERLRTDDVISRFGGDEFTVLIPEFKIKSAEAVAHKILSAFEEPIGVNGTAVKISGNIGICVYPGCGDTAESLINNANLALEHSKEIGRNVFYLCDYARQSESRVND